MSQACVSGMLLGLAPTPDNSCQSSRVSLALVSSRKMTVPEAFAPRLSPIAFLQAALYSPLVSRSHTPRMPLTWLGFIAVSIWSASVNTSGA